MDEVATATRLSMSTMSRRGSGGGWSMSRCLPGRAAATPISPVPCADKQGLLHLCWVWRDSADCATNHDLCYARSKDMVHWETSAGRPLRLPITLATAEVIDPVPTGGGIINSNLRIGFDAVDRPVISYQKAQRGRPHAGLQRPARGPGMENLSDQQLGLSLGVFRRRHDCSRTGLRRGPGRRGWPPLADVLPFEARRGHLAAGPRDVAGRGPPASATSAIRGADGRRAAAWNAREHSARPGPER